jgi:hypothetical protein
MSDNAPEEAAPSRQNHDLEHDVPSNLPATLDPQDAAQVQELVNDIQAALRTVRT